MRQIPNILTTARILIALLFPFIGNQYWLFVIFVAAATEFFDGYLARRLNAETKLGRFLDPIADKIFLSSIVFTFLYFDHIALWQILLLALREFTILSGVIWLIYKKEWDRFNLMSPQFSGKVATWAQYIFIISIGLFLKTEIFLFVPAVAISAWASWQYIHVFLEQGKIYKQNNS